MSTEKKKFKYLVTYYKVDHSVEVHEVVRAFGPNSKKIITTFEELFEVLENDDSILFSMVFFSKDRSDATKLRPVFILFTGENGMWLFEVSGREEFSDLRQYMLKLLRTELKEYILEYDLKPNVTLPYLTNTEGGRFTGAEGEYDEDRIA
jgi:hypothetical protein